MKKNNKYIHISVDDFSESFKDITEKKYISIFENSNFKFFQKLHNKYGAVISCYCFKNFNGFNLSDTTQSFQEEFKINSRWLKFGFHGNGENNYSNSGKEEALKDYNSVINELYRITGNINSINRFIRLENFAGNIESIRAIKNTQCGISGLFGADDKRRSYYLSKKSSEYLYRNDEYYDEKEKIIFYKTDIRIENINDINELFNELDTKFLENKKRLVVFTHEWKLQDEKVRCNMEKMCEYAVDNGLRFIW